MSEFSRRSFLASLGSSTFVMGMPAAFAAPGRFQVIVYGGTSSGIIAAYAAARAGLKVALVLGPSATGGMTANGLGHSDVNQAMTLEAQKIGGLTARFFRTMGKTYGKPYAYRFEPHVALKYFLDLLDDGDISFYAQEFDESNPLTKEGTKITSLLLEDGTRLAGEMFIDCSYEGDLMAAAGVSFDYGRDAKDRFNEPLAGFGVSQRVVSKIKTRTKSGYLLPLVKPFPKTAVGGSDRGVMSYSYRLCLTDDATDRVPFRKPARYNADWYLLDLQRAMPNTGFHAGTDLTGTRKVDRNNDEPVGQNWAYSMASRAERKTIADFHKTYAAGRLYFYANDPRVPQFYRDSTNEWGLSRSEFTHSGNWPRQMYIRESRRLRGLYKMTQADITTARTYPDTVMWWAYGIDSHSVQYLEGPNGEMIIEGANLGKVVDVKSKRYPVPMRAFLPLQSQCTNLVVPVCASVSRIVNCSYRMEPAYMLAGEVAGVIAAQAIAARTTVQRVAASDVVTVLRRNGAII